MTLAEQINNGENKSLEFKETLPKNENIAKTVIAFSNTSGGKLIIGVNDKREVIGVDDGHIFEMQDKIASIIADNCSPGIIPEIYIVNIEGKLVLVIEVFRGNLKPYFLKSHGKADGTYIRLGATNRAADLETIAELERQRRHVSYDEEICFDKEFKELDISPLLKKFQEKGKTLDEEKLKNLKLIKNENGKSYPTNALMIILGEYWHCSVKCARFKGTTMSVFTDKKEYGGDIFSILENTQSFVLNHINLKGEIKGLYRTDTYEIPVPAIREALVNAVVHRDYINKGRDIKVGIYDDIVNIVSPGGLPNTITIEDAFNGRSEARNRVLANVFKELGLIEQWGTGLNRIINACKEHGLPIPKIEEKNDFFDIEIIRPQPIMDKLPVDTQRELLEEESFTTDYDRLRPIATDYDRLNLEEKKILLYLVDNAKISRREAVKILGLGETKIKEIFNDLLGKKLINRSGKGRSTFYKLTDKKEENKKE